jgi:hypothetical protein
VAIPSRYESLSCAETHRHELHRERRQGEVRPARSRAKIHQRAMTRIFGDSDSSLSSLVPCREETIENPPSSFNARGCIIDRDTQPAHAMYPARIFHDDVAALRLVSCRSNCSVSPVNSRFDRSIDRSIAISANRGELDCIDCRQP